ncbi:helicase-related protein, partial [Escherichia coli]|nr:helicase-related protein [Escherichia coli]
TTVVEVGVDVPNATVMLIEHAERFGLSQLHQLRGRVGRGSDKSFCVLMTGDRQTATARKRLGIMEETSDGFKIAE